MTKKTIHKLRIGNFKSIDALEIKGLSPFSVFAGANGSGKSNFFDALDFVSLFVRNGIESALREHGGFANIKPAKRYGSNSRKFTFELEGDFQERGEKPATSHYLLSIFDLGNEPEIDECLKVDGKLRFKRKKGENSIVVGGSDARLRGLPDIYSGLSIFSEEPLTELLKNLHVYRIDPAGAKEPDKSDLDPARLERKGHNLASVLNRLEREGPVRGEISDWMEMIVPGIETIQTEKQRLDSSTALLFKEEGTRKRFPAHLVSDGTMHALCLLVTVLDQPAGGGMTLIEEPERGLHAKAIRELTDLMRQQASPENPIWLTTHSESVVRAINLDELVLVDKVEGLTRMKPADSGNLSEEHLASLGLDQAWLSNLLNGGLPW